MKHHRKTSDRINDAAADLLAGHGASTVVSFVTRREGVSKRTAQRAVAAAYKLITSDIEQVDRRQLLAQMVDNCQAVIAQSLATGNSGAAIAAVKTLSELVGLTTPAKRQ